MKNVYLEEDRKRYADGKIPLFQVAWRKAQAARIYPIKIFWLVMLRFFRRLRMVELPAGLQADGGLLFGHSYGITINPDVKIGAHVNIHKGVTIGIENRGQRKGIPTIGNRVWIGANAAIVGGVNIGNDVLIAPNAFVNFDVPDHSVVIGNPGVIHHKENATLGYL